MQEIKIPEGHKATILGGTIRIEPIEKKQKFERGDIVSVIHPTKGKWIFIYETLVEGDYFYLACYESLNGELTFDDYCYYDKGGFKFATHKEQQLLFDALAKEGKYWDAEALEVKDLIKVPESIGIYRYKEEFNHYKVSGDNLYVAFNEYRQLLGTSNDVYEVIERDGTYFEKVQCYLQPCKREDLKAGDTVFMSDSMNKLNYTPYYFKVLSDIMHVSTALNEEDIITGISDWTYYYKLVPIDK